MIAVVSCDGEGLVDDFLGGVEVEGNCHEESNRHEHLSNGHCGGHDGAHDHGADGILIHVLFQK